MSNEIKFAIMNSFIYPWQERVICFDCKLSKFNCFIAAFLPLQRAHSLAKSLSHDI